MEFDPPNHEPPSGQGDSGPPVFLPPLSLLGDHTPPPIDQQPPTSYLRTRLDEDLDSSPPSAHHPTQVHHRYVPPPRLQFSARPENPQDYAPNPSYRHRPRMDREDQLTLHQSADRRADRLRDWRSGRQALHDTFVAALRKWKADDPATYNTFERHMENSALVCTSTVRAHDVMMWGANKPREVDDILPRLCVHYHVEARLRQLLVEAEARTDNWTGLDEMDEEEEHAAATTGLRVDRNGIKLDTVTFFGEVGTEIQIPYMFDWDPEFHPSRHAYLVRMQALIELSEVYLDHTTNSDPERFMMEKAYGFLGDFTKKAQEILVVTGVAFNTSSIADQNLHRRTYDYARNLVGRVGGDTRLKEIFEVRHEVRKFIIFMQERIRDRRHVDPAHAPGFLLEGWVERIKAGERRHGGIFGRRWRELWES